MDGHVMLKHFYQLGQEIAWHEATKTAGWAAPVLGGLGGAALGAWALPHLGSQDVFTNPALGALVGAGLGVGGVEAIRALRKLVATGTEPAIDASLDGMTNALRDLKAAHPEWDWSPKPS